MQADKCELHLGIAEEMRWSAANSEWSSFHLGFSLFRGD
jgi:hypothetical protein